jgi:hypothetical protein
MSPRCVLGTVAGGPRKVVVTRLGHFPLASKPGWRYIGGDSRRQQMAVRRETGNQGGNHRRMKGRVAVPPGGDYTCRIAESRYRALPIRDSGRLVVSVWRSVIHGCVSTPPYGTVRTGQMVRIEHCPRVFVLVTSANRWSHFGLTGRDGGTQGMGRTRLECREGG